jgi:HK97 family phage prohead protease
MDRHDLLTRIEHRLYRLDDLEIRAAKDPGGAVDLTGYASVFDHGYDMFGGPPFPGWTEYVKPGAFKRTLRNKADVQLLVNHEGMPLARTKSGTMALAEDDTGLHVDAQLEPTDPDVQRLVPKMRRRDLDEMSFAFRVVKDAWFNEDGEAREAWDEDAVVRHLLEVSIHKGDVSVVNYGANDGTSTQLLDIDRALVELRAGRSLDPGARAAVVARLGPDPTNSPVEPEREPHLETPAETLSLATALALATADRDHPAA